jgi:hypothetical protein
MTMLGGAAPAIADNLVCPAVASITEKGQADNETQFSSSAGGVTWEGSVSDYDEPVDLQDLRFAGAAIDNNAKRVMCDYHSGKKGALRMATSVTASLAPAAPAAWTHEPGKPEACASDNDVMKCAIK